VAPCVRLVVASTESVRGAKNGTTFTQSFKIQAVEKALERAGGYSMKEVGDYFKLHYSRVSRII